MGCYLLLRMFWMMFGGFINEHQDCPFFLVLIKLHLNSDEISAADVLLWRKKHLSAGFLVGATVVWLLFEWIGYHVISVISFLLLGFVVVLFAWSNGAAFLNR